MIQPAFHKTKLNGLVGIVQDEIESYFNSTWAQSNSREIYPDMHHLAFRIVARALFSTALADTEIDLLSKDISKIQAFIVRRIRQPYLHPWFKVSGKMRLHDRISADVRSVLLGVIRKPMAAYLERAVIREIPKDVIGQGLDRIELQLQRSFELK